MSTLPGHEFSKENYYLFAFNQFGGEPNTVIVADAAEVYDDRLLFIFLFGLKSDSATVPKSEVLAVGDRDGTVRLVGWTGSYTVLNQELFDSYVKKGILRLK